MAQDRNSFKLNEGDVVRIIPGMCKGFVPVAIIQRINGEYIMLNCIDFDGYQFIAERYGCELWSIEDGQPGKDI